MAFFEGLGPLIEVAGYVVVTVAAVAGLLNWEIYGALILASLLFGTATTLRGWGVVQRRGLERQKKAA